MSGRKGYCGFQGGPAEMFLVENVLGLDQLSVKFWQRHPCRQHGVLNIEEAIIPCLNLARLCVPALSSGVRSVDTDRHNLRDFCAPLPDGLESLPVPVGIGD